MMNRGALSKLGVAVFMVVALVAGILTGLYTQHIDPTKMVRERWTDIVQKPEDVTVPVSMPLPITNTLVIRKNGEVVYVKEGDPWTLNAARLILKFALGSTGSVDNVLVPAARINKGSLGNIVTASVTIGNDARHQGQTDSNVVTDYATPGNPVIGIGSGTNPYSPTDTSLQSVLSLYDVLDSTNIVFTDAPSYVELNITAAFTNVNGTVSEVGLFRRLAIGRGGIPDNTPLVLLSRDVLSSPITLTSTDSLSVLYSIRVAKTPPLTYNGARYILAVLLGLRRNNLPVGLSVNTYSPSGQSWAPVIDIINNANCNVERIRQPCIKIALSSTTATVTNPFYIVNPPTYGPTTLMDPSWSTISYNSTHIILRTRYIYVPPTATTIGAVVLYRDNDFTGSSVDQSRVVSLTAFTTRVYTIYNFNAATGAAYVLFYVPLPSPITLPPGGRLIIELTFSLPIA